MAFWRYLFFTPFFPLWQGSGEGRRERDEYTVITGIKASKLVDSVPMVSARKARPIETTEILQKCVSFWQLHSQSFISSHCDQPITPHSFQGHYSRCGGCVSHKQMLILLNVLSVQLSLSQIKNIEALFRERKYKRSEK